MQRESAGETGPLVELSSNESKVYYVSHYKILYPC